MVLKDSDWVLGFLSRHSVRDPGVCLDELGIALHEKGGAIATVLIEGEAMASPPVSKRSEVAAPQRKSSLRRPRPGLSRAVFHSMRPARLSVGVQRAAWRG
jgi:hypothetical protein